MTLRFPRLVTNTLFINVYLPLFLFYWIWLSILTKVPSSTSTSTISPTLPLRFRWTISSLRRCIRYLLWRHRWLQRTIAFRIRSSVERPDHWGNNLNDVCVIFYLCRFRFGLFRFFLRFYWVFVLAHLKLSPFLHLLFSCTVTGSDDLHSFSVSFFIFNVAPSCS